MEFYRVFMLANGCSIPIVRLRNGTLAGLVIFDRIDHSTGIDNRFIGVPMVVPFEVLQGLARADFSYRADGVGPSMPFHPGFCIYAAMELANRGEEGWHFDVRGYAGRIVDEALYMEIQGAHHMAT